MYPGLAALLDDDADDPTGRAIGLLGYGSGGVAEFFAAVPFRATGRGCGPSGTARRFARRLRVYEPRWRPVAGGTRPMAAPARRCAGGTPRW